MFNQGLEVCSACLGYELGEIGQLLHILQTLEDLGLDFFVGRHFRKFHQNANKLAVDERELRSLPGEVP